MSGSTPAQSSIVSFAIQPAKIGKTGTFVIGALDWYKFNTLDNAVGTVQDQQVFPPESGGTVTPRGSYKQSHLFGGVITLIPRLENAFGYLLKAVMGNSSTVTGKTADGATAVGVNTHIFNFSSDGVSQPWLAVRRHIPTPGGAYFGETGFDCKIGGLELTIPAMGKIVARIQMIGRDSEFTNASNAWAYANANFEDTLNTADSGRGFFKIGGVEYPALGASFQMDNGLTSVQQEIAVGDMRPLDFQSLTRAAQIQFVYKYEDSGLYQKILTGSPTGVAWNSLPFILDSAGATKALDARFMAPGLIGATIYPHAIEVRANKVTLAVNGPIQLQPGNIITQTFTLTVLTPTGSQDYLQFILENNAVGY